jgi:hypothetical protein
MHLFRFHFFYFLLLTAPLLLLTACSSGKETQKSVLEPQALPLLEEGKTWRGGAIGGTLGQAVEGKRTAIAARARKEALRDNVPIVYISLDGLQRVEVYPRGNTKQGKCREVMEQIFKDGKQIQEEIKEECP